MYISLRVSRADSIIGSSTLRERKRIDNIMGIGIKKCISSHMKPKTKRDYITIYV